MSEGDQPAYFSMYENIGADKAELGDLRINDLSSNAMNAASLTLTGMMSANELSTSSQHANTLTVNDGTANELSVHTLFIDQIATSQIDAGFNFQDDIQMQGDLTVDGSIFVKNLIFTCNATTLSVPVFQQDPPVSTNSPGIKGKVVVSDDYLYVCTGPDTWKRVALSAW